MPTLAGLVFQDLVGRRKCARCLSPPAQNYRVMVISGSLIICSCSGSHTATSGHHQSVQDHTFSNKTYYQYGSGYRQRCRKLDGSDEQVFIIAAETKLIRCKVRSANNWITFSSTLKGVCLFMWQICTCDKA